MDLQSAERLMDIVIDSAVRVLAAGFGVDRAEPAFFQLIELIREQPALKPALLARIDAALQAPDPGILARGLPPRELIELIAHELRWHELHELAEKRMRNLFGGSESLAASDVSRSILEAEADDWPDRAFYLRYQRR
jgi:hypothetical protein